MDKVRVYKTDNGTIVANSNNEVIYGDCPKNYTLICRPDHKSPGNVMEARWVERLLTPGTYWLRPRTDLCLREGGDINPKITILGVTEVSLSTYVDAVTKIGQLQAEYDSQTRPILNTFQEVASRVLTTYNSRIRDLENERDEKLQIVEQDKQVKLASLNLKPVPTLEELLK